LDPNTWAEADEALTALLTEAVEQTFEDGIENPFSVGLRSYLATYGLFATDMMKRYCFSELANPAVLGELLRQIGLSNHGGTRDARFQILVMCLRHPFAAVRDGAGLGLAFIRDARAIPYLWDAIQREGNSRCRAGLELAAADLQS